jgi:hypothetical protein
MKPISRTVSRTLKIEVEIFVDSWDFEKKCPPDQCRYENYGKRKCRFVYLNHLNLDFRCSLFDKRLKGVINPYSMAVPRRCPDCIKLFGLPSSNETRRGV